MRSPAGAAAGAHSGARIGLAAMADQTSSWTLRELESELLRFEAELRAAGLAENSVKTYVERSERFLRWLVGEFTPRGPRD